MLALVVSFVVPNSGMSCVRVFQEQIPILITDLAVESVELELLL